MRLYQIAVLYVCTVLTVNCLYIPQPIQPLLAEIYGVSLVHSALLTTLTLLPLGIAPIAYGTFVESISPKFMMSLSLFLLALGQFFFVWVDDFGWMIGARVFQGFLFPAILTSIMTYISQYSVPNRVGRNIRVYIAITIIGGFLGRFLSGWFTQILGWQFHFIFSGVFLLIAFCGVFSLEGIRDKKVRLDISAFRKVLSNRIFFRIYLTTFLAFFIFTAIMNFIPFRISHIDGVIDPGRAGTLYLGYLCGIFTSLLVTRAQRIFDDRRFVPLLSLIFLSMSLLSFLIPVYEVTLVGLLVVCGCFFFNHAFFSGYLNDFSSINKGMVNGLYVSFYYTGGSLGSFLPGVLFELAGWEWFLVLLLFLAACQGVLIYSLGTLNSKT